MKKAVKKSFYNFPVVVVVVILGAAFGCAFCQHLHLLTVVVVFPL